jgi:hypothetical protein
MIKKNHQIWYENSMKLNNKGWNCKKKKTITQEENSKSKGIAIIRIRFKFNKKKLESNDQGLNWKIKFKSKINWNQKNKDQIWGKKTKKNQMLMDEIEK